jgi:hypothetical protein
VSYSSTFLNRNLALWPLLLVLIQRRKYVTSLCMFYLTPSFQRWYANHASWSIYAFKLGHINCFSASTRCKPHYIMVFFIRFIVFLVSYWSYRTSLFVTYINHHAVDRCRSMNNILHNIPQTNRRPIKRSRVTSHDLLLFRKLRKRPLLL